MRGLVAVALVVLLGRAGIACTPGTPGPVTPYDAADGGPPPCEVDQRITAQRLIRTDSGAPLVLAPCPDSGTTVTVIAPDGAVLRGR